MYIHNPLGRISYIYSRQICNKHVLPHPKLSHIILSYLILSYPIYPVSNFPNIILSHIIPSYLISSINLSYLIFFYIILYLIILSYIFLVMSYIISHLILSYLFMIILQTKPHPFCFISSLPYLELFHLILPHLANYTFLCHHTLFHLTFISYLGFILSQK